MTFTPNAMLGIAGRELRKFFHSPVLIFVAILGPLVQLLVMGNVFGGHVTGARVGIVDCDRGPQALRFREALAATANTTRMFTMVELRDEQAARTDVLAGRLNAAVILPSDLTRRRVNGGNPHVGLLLDNADQFLSQTLAAKLQEITTDLGAPSGGHGNRTLAMETVELHPYIEYIKYLFPGTLTLAIFLAVMFGGVMLWMEDKNRGVHEGFLVTPITRLELVLGMVLAGSAKAMICGTLFAILGSLMAGLGLLLHPLAFLAVLLMMAATSFAFNALSILLFCRVDDVMLPKVLVGLLNTLLFFPSGAVYPIHAFPAWLRLLSKINPMTYAVHGFRELLIRDAGFRAVLPDFLLLCAIGAVALTAGTRLFRRSL
jgi:ABC-2 type transport system permease protein